MDDGDMNFTIETANTSAALRTAARIREQVFGEQHSYRKLPRLDTYAPWDMVTLIAKTTDTNTAVATVSLVDTTWDSELHSAVGLKFPASARVARFSQMAVLPAFRGLHIPARLMAEAQVRFITPRGITHTWLLFPAETAHTSYFCTDMGFSASAGVFATEYGQSRVLVRNEADHARREFALDAFPAIAAVWPPALRDNEWLAQ
jgi:hypothetical protein